MSKPTLLINGRAGTGKTSLLSSLRKAFVISRDGKEFPFEIPHMFVPEYHGMSIVLYGGTIKGPDGQDIFIEGVPDKLQKYVDIYGHLPETVVIDSISKLMLDAIEYANLHFTNFDVHTFINKEMAILTKFVQEYLVANGLQVVLINHVMENDKKGYIPVGQGKFKDRGGYYAEVNHAILIEPEGNHFVVHHYGEDKQARTLIPNMPAKQYVANIVDPSKSKQLKEGEKYYSLQEHLDLISETLVASKAFQI